jgi:serine protease AprX
MALLVPGVAYGQSRSEAKFDESLRKSMKHGCSGTKSVIIRTTPGAREALSKSLLSQGRRVKGEFPALDAITADVSCADLKALAGFKETASISDNAKIHGHQLGGVIPEPPTTVTEEPAAPVAEEPLAPVTQEPAAVPAEETVDEGALGAFSSKSAASGIHSSQSTSRLNEALSVQQLQGNLFSTLGVRSSLTPLLNGAVPSIGIAIVDSGIAPGVDFGARITAFYDFTQGDIRLVAPSDTYGHGTHVAGLAAGTYVGVAPTARLIGLRVLNAQGQGTTDNVIRAVEFAIANKDVLDIDVINLSLGHPIFESAATDPLVQAVEHASRVGIKVVISAGNFGRNRTTGEIGYAGLASPGNAPSGISVASVRTFDTVDRDDDRIAPYSSRGPSWYDGFAKPDISAPGDNVLSVASVGSTLRLAQEKRGNSGNYMRLSGTSMAAGVVSGLVAVILKDNPNLTPNAMKMVLQYSSIPVKNDDGTYADALTQGAGAINGYGAMALARAINPAAAVGTEWLTANITPSSTIGGRTYVWAQRMIWGNHIARGTGVITEQRPAWALDIVWGDGLEDDDNIVWGNLADDDNIVWGNALDVDDNIVWGNNLVWGNSQDDDDNIVWGNLLDDDNIVWGNFDDDNIVWGNNLVWGNSLIRVIDDDNIVWGNNDDDNIVWGNLDDDNIVWGNLDDDNIVWGNNIVWGSGLIGLSIDDDNIVWGNLDDDNIVWGNLDDDNIVWGNLYNDNLVRATDVGDDDNIVWGNSSQLGTVLKWSGGFVSGKASNARARRTPGREGVR